MNPHPQRRLLLIDDHREVLRALALSLEIEGYAVKSAQTFLEAEIFLRNEKFDLVICDYLLPQLTGPELREKLATQLDLPPFLFCSGMAVDVDGHFMAKPFQISDLICKITAVLSTVR